MYGLFTGFTTFLPTVMLLLLLLSAITEVGGRRLRIYLTASYPVSLEFSVNSIVCYLGGMLAYTALLGSTTGFVVWQLLAGKVLIPRTDTIAAVLLRLAGVAGIRFLGGSIMIIIIHLYIFV